MSDGSFAWDVYVPQGGSTEPMTIEGLEQGRQYLDVMDPVGMKDRLERLSLSNWLICIDKALAKGGFARSDVDYLATLLVKRSAHDYSGLGTGSQSRTHQISRGIRPSRPERPDTLIGTGPRGKPPQGTATWC